MSDTVFILGAGASAKAGAPVVRDFLDAADQLLRDGTVHVSGDRATFEFVARGRAALDAAHAKATIDGDDLESVFGAFEMAALFRQRLGELSEEHVRELPEAIRRVIIRTLEERVVFPIRDSPRGGEVVAPDGYGQFLDVLQKLRERREAVSVITFNYDLAFDYTLFRAKIPVDYGLSDEAPDKEAVTFLKLHGSLNWVSCINARQTCGGIVPLGLEPFTKWKMENRDGGERLRISQALHSCPKCQGGTHEPRPVIVPPTWNKNHHHEGVASVWRQAARRLRRASRIVVIGYSLPETDQFFRYLYALGSMGETRLRLFLVVNPNQQVEERFRRLLGRGVERRFLFRQWSFAGGMMPLAALLIEGKEWKQEVEPENPSSNTVTWGR